MATPKTHPSLSHIAAHVCLFLHCTKLCIRKPFIGVLVPWAFSLSVWTCRNEYHTQNQVTGITNIENRHTNCKFPQVHSEFCSDCGLAGLTQHMRQTNSQTNFCSCSKEFCFAALKKTSRKLSKENARLMLEIGSSNVLQEPSSLRPNCRMLFPLIVFFLGRTSHLEHPAHAVPFPESLELWIRTSIQNIHWAQTNKNQFQATQVSCARLFPSAKITSV